jgi:hypothetical protein
MAELWDGPPSASTVLRHRPALRQQLPNSGISESDAAVLQVPRQHRQRLRKYWPILSITAGSSRPARRFGTQLRLVADIA